MRYLRQRAENEPSCSRGCREPCLHKLQVLLWSMEMSVIVKSIDPRCTGRNILLAIRRDGPSTPSNCSAGLRSAR